MVNLDLWEKLAKPPKEALREIKGGRLAGKTDINPQWRLKAMTDAFGPIGIGWNYRVERMWLEPGAEGTAAAFVVVAVKYKYGDAWSEEVHGSGGSMFVEKEKSGLRTSDEAYKMATTDALSVAMKQLGVAAAIYQGQWDGSKYRDEPAPKSDKQALAEIHAHSEPAPEATSTTQLKMIQPEDRTKAVLLAKECVRLTGDKVRGADLMEELTGDQKYPGYRTTAALEAADARTSKPDSQHWLIKRAWERLETHKVYGNPPQDLATDDDIEAIFGKAK